MTVVGLLGGGQLARMLALAGTPLGLRFRCLDPAPSPPASAIAEHVRAAYDDHAALTRFIDGLEVITYEFENVPAAVAAAVDRRVPVYPTPEALRVSQDRLAEKEFLRWLGVPTAPFVPVDAPEALPAALAAVGLPAIIKRRRLGYDGVGQAVIADVLDAHRAWIEVGGEPAVVEGRVSFARELSIIAVRGTSGETRFYPLVENHHTDGVLRWSIAPALDVASELQHQAEELAARVLRAWSYVGVLVLELFEVDGKLVVNEIAPRVHNSGHWTIEGAVTSQFENHLRAILDLPLGSTAARGHAAMINLLGEVPPAAPLLAEGDLHLHNYGKDPRPGRKVGHCTVLASSATSRDRRARAVLKRLYPELVAIP